MRLGKSLEERLQRAAAASEEEICGALIGTADDIVEAIALSNHSKDPASSFYIAATDILELERSGHRVSGFYHSHPHGAAQPSARDLEQAVPGFIYLIVTRSGDARAWLLRDDRTAFDEVRISRDDN